MNWQVQEERCKLKPVEIPERETNGKNLAVDTSGFLLPVSISLHNLVQKSPDSLKILFTQVLRDWKGWSGYVP